MTRTTFTSLTAQAAARLDSASAQLPLLGPESDRAQLAARQGDLSAALALLGRRILSVRGATRPTADSRLLEQLEQRAAPHDWEGAAPTPGSPAAAMAEAARAIRAAADLWATHHGPAGRPRSPEASMMRHPAMAGAAVKHWRRLVGAAADLAVLLSAEEDRSAQAAPGPYPRPRRLARTLPDVPLTVARPPLRPSPDPLVAIEDQIDRIHRCVWTLAEQQRVNAAVLRNVAAIGMLLARATADAEQHAFSATSTMGKQIGKDLLAHWTSTAELCAGLRTPDAGHTVLQVERLDLARLIDRLRRSEPESTRTALQEACASYGRVAAISARELRDLAKRGEIYMVGRALPRSLVSRRPDLVADRLADRLVPAPAVVLRRLEASLVAVAAVPRRAEGESAA